MRQLNPNPRSHRDESSIRAGIALYFGGQIRGVLLT
jgi:hypothetical protein